MGVSHVSHVSKATITKMSSAPDSAPCFFDAPQDNQYKKPNSQSGFFGPKPISMPSRDLSCTRT